MRRVVLISLVAVLVFSFGMVNAQEINATKPGKGDKCPVCGMFVAKYPDFLAEVVFKDGARFFFDGSKDMFKYYFEVGRYTPGKKAGDIQGIFVTDYYSLSPIDAKAALYVLDSDVHGPMGRECIPFASRTDATEFMDDHGGKELLPFDGITLPKVKGLD